jgi:polar amino acid transport system substrate-binding protein
MRTVILQLVLVIVNTAHISYAGEPVVFVTSAYEPYVIDEGAVASGIFPDVVRAAFHESDTEVVFRFQPWKGTPIV